MSTLILASASPRRQELLQLLKYPFVTQPADIIEQQQPNESPEAYVQRLAQEKALAVLVEHNQQANVAVLGSDTIVVVENEILEKPVNYQHFQSMMQRLSGRSHYVLTAVCLATAKQQWQCCVATEVSFRQLSAQDIETYWASGEPHDKAGGYGIQGLAGKFVTRLNGSYFAVVGLPLYETEHLLKQWLATDSE
ncbi:MAF protein [Idiomarina sp. A28L]|uniref:Maf family protein n=1 Tax=Idiomarina sp. A28L TaxID=1036674 RepID=UPI000213883D|nr:Maf family protein [Idiomarina sp. A28L]EGN74890.1 MAF protein [Idiomarina sp. A28L]